MDEKPAPSDGRAELPVTGMSCAGCAANVERGLRGLPGVREAIAGGVRSVWTGAGTFARGISECFQGRPGGGITQRGAYLGCRL